jgi:hypothetical protein
VAYRVWILPLIRGFRRPEARDGEPCRTTHASRLNLAGVVFEYKQFSAFQKAWKKAIQC